MKLDRRRPHPSAVVLTLLGVGAMRSPRYPPAGLLIAFGRHRVMIDGGPGAEPRGKLAAWLVTDDQCELMPSLRALARSRGLVPSVGENCVPGLSIEPHPVIHTSHPAFGYLIEIERSGATFRVAWAPEFFAFPGWASRVDLMLGEAASYERPVLFAHGVGGHMAALDVARAAARRRVRRLVFAHIGRSSIRARDAHLPLPFGQWGDSGQRFVIPIDRRLTANLERIAARPARA